MQLGQVIYFILTRKICNRIPQNMPNQTEVPSQDALKAKVGSMPSWVQAQYYQGAAVTEGLSIIKTAIAKVIFPRGRTDTNDPLDRYPMGIYSLGSDILHGKGEFAKKK